MYTLDGIYEVNKTLSWKNLDNVAFRRADKLARTSSQLTDEEEMARIQCFLAGIIKENNFFCDILFE